MKYNFLTFLSVLCVLFAHAATKSNIVVLVRYAPKFHPMARGFTGYYGFL